MNIFPSINNKMGMNSVKKFLDERACKDPPNYVLLGAFKLRLSYNNSVFNNNGYIQTDGTAQGPHMLFPYSDIAIGET